MTKDKPTEKYDGTEMEQDTDKNTCEAWEPTRAIAINYGVPNPSAPWRHQDYGKDGALASEQVADLAARFEIDREELWKLSKDLGFYLGTSQPQNMTFVDMKLAEQRGKERLAKAKQQAKAALGNLQRCTYELSGLSYLDRHYDEENPFKSLETEIEAIKLRTRALHVDLSQYASKPGSAMDLRPPDKRKIQEYHRKNVLFSIFVIWHRIGRKLSVTTDHGTSERDGPLIEFANAVIECVTDPATPLAGETIFRDLLESREKVKGYDASLAEIASLLKEAREKSQGS